MSASFLFTPAPASLDLGPFGAVRVYRLDAKGLGVLPHVRAVADQWREGPHPGSAQCYYTFDEAMAEELGTPTRFEEVWGLGATGPWVVRIDDELVIAQELPNGKLRVVFHGFATAPQLDLSDSQERVTFQIVGGPVREWDTPLGGAVYRDAIFAADSGDWDTKTRLNEHDVLTHLPARFNPDGEPNATPAGADADSGDGTFSYPVFLDRRVVRDVEVRRHWTLGMAAAYVICRGNPSRSWTRYDDVLWQIEGLLKVRVPADPSAPIDPNDPKTFKWEDVLAQDLDVTGKTWPEALGELIEPHGFSYTWRLTSGKNVDGPAPTAKEWPVWQLVIYRKDEPTRSVTFGLQPAGEDLDPAQTSVGQATLNMDSSRIINVIVVDTEPVLYEVTAGLVPLFEIDPADAAKDNRGKFKKTGEIGYLPGGSKYRDFGLDETGEGHWSWEHDAWYSVVDKLPNEADSLVEFTDGLVEAMAKLFAGDVAEGTDLTKWAEKTLANPKRFAVRRRPARRKLVTYDPASHVPLEARLWLCTNYEGKLPGFFTPNPAASPAVVLQAALHGWDLLKERFGIRITCNDPNAWEAGVPYVPGSGTKIMADAPFPSGVVKVVECLADPGAGGDKTSKRFDLFLTAVLEGDRGLKAVASRRASSPTRYPIARREDARDRYSKGVVAPESENNEFATPYVMRDDTKVAAQHARARQAAHEAVKLAGTLTVPRLVWSVGIGDQVSAITGRDVDLRVVATAGTKEALRYPVVVGITHQYHPRLSTTYQLDDRRAEPVRTGHEGGLTHGRPG